jgi:hypothetical protein
MQKQNPLAYSTTANTLKEHFWHFGLKLVSNS